MPAADVVLRPWTAADLEVLHRLNTAAMTELLGGPEPEAKVLERLQRYVAASSGDTRMFVIEVGHGEAAGSIGCWPREWRGKRQFETGWGVFPEYQGQGVATAAVAQLVDQARRNGVDSAIHAFPEIHNDASNALCRTAGFKLLGEASVEYPPGNPIIVNDWVLDPRPVAGRG